MGAIVEVATFVGQFICFVIAGDVGVSLDPSKRQGTGAAYRAVKGVACLSKGGVGMGFSDAQRKVSCVTGIIYDFRRGVRRAWAFILEPCQGFCYGCKFPCVVTSLFGA